MRFLLPYFFTFLLSTSALAQDLSVLFEQLSPSVVTIQVTIMERAGDRDIPKKGLGTGVVIDTTGLVLTAAHVVQDAFSITIKFSDGRYASAEVLTSVPSADVALIKMRHPPSGLTIAPLGISAENKVGHEVMVIGAPMGFENSLSTGHLSGRVDLNMMSNGTILRYLQTDAAINQGNSGGPIFNMKGEVIGIVSSILSHSGGFEGIGFGVDIYTIRNTVLSQESMWTGFDGVFLSEEQAKLLNVPQRSGLLVQRVASGSFAQKLGLSGGYTRTDLGGETLWLGGDIILSIQGIACDAPHSFENIRTQLEALNEGESVLVTVLRGGKIEELSNIKVQLGGF